MIRSFATRLSERRHWLIPSLVVFACALAAHLWQVFTFSNGVPYWDQWDSEGMRLLRPWIDGSLGPMSLIQAHNEHRILPTRLVTLLVFTLNGGVWNNLAEAFFNAFIYALVPAYLAYRVAVGSSMRVARITTLATIAALAMLPYGWENTLVGFQSQFYFVLLFTLPALALLSFRPESLGALAAVVTLVGLSSLTMASGLLTGVAASAVVMFNLINRRIHWDQAFLSWILIGGVVAIAYKTMPQVAGHDFLKATSVVEILRSAAIAASWPGARPSLLTVVIWLPSAIVIARMVLRKAPASCIDYFMAGCIGWNALQCLAIGYSRGHDMQHIASRYSDLLMPGLVAAAWFAGRLWQWSAGRLRTLALTLGGLAILALAIGLAMRTPGDVQEMRNRHAQSLIQAANVKAYLRDGDPGHLFQPPMQIPYPNAILLRQYLDDPVLRPVLPFKEARNPPPSR